MDAEKPAPKRKAMARPILTSTSPGSRKSSAKTTTAKIARVRNWRLR